MPYKFSPSSLSLLKECPRCFWLHFNKGIRRPEGIFPSLPSGMDKILKIHFDSFRAKDKLPPEISELDSGVKLFDNVELLEVWRNNRKGIQWTDEKGNVFHGAIDDILQKDDKLTVLDFKTRGFPLKEDTADLYNDQMNIYNLLLRKNGHKTENYGYLLFYHPEKVNGRGDVVFNTDLVKLEINVKNAESIFEEAIRVLEGDEPEASQDCGTCRYLCERNDVEQNG